MGDLARGRGFTLIEILVVIVIIGIMSSLAMMTLGRDEVKDQQAFAKWLTANLLLIEKQAMLQPATLGIHFTADFLTVSQFDDKKKRWVSSTLDSAQKKLPSNIRITLSSDSNDGEEEEAKPVNSPQIIFTANGDVTPFSLLISSKSKAAHFRVRGESNGDIRMETISATE